MPKSILPHIGRRGWPSPLALDQLNLILGNSFATELWMPAKAACGLRGRTSVLAEAPCNGVALREYGRANTALSAGKGVWSFGQPLRQVVQSCLGSIDSQMAGAATG